METDARSSESVLVSSNGGEEGEGEGEGERERSSERYREMISSLPKEKGWTMEHMYQYQGFWYPSIVVLEGVMWMQDHFKPRREDVLLVTSMKSGTTWFKSLLFATMNRAQFDFPTHPLLTTSPHELVPFLEMFFRMNIPFPDHLPQTHSPPRLFHTHVPFTSLPQSVLQSHCRILYVSRDPKDVFVSLCRFLQRERARESQEEEEEEDSPVLRLRLRLRLSFEEAFEQYCNGVSPYGPLWDHMLGYLEASTKWPERVLLLKYEDMKRDSSFHLKRMAQFIGLPFSSEEENQGVVHEIIKLCSFENLSSLKVNEKGTIRTGDLTVDKSSFFRKGEVGDWKNHLTAEMAERLDKIMKEILNGF